MYIYFKSIFWFVIIHIIYIKVQYVLADWWIFFLSDLPGCMKWKKDCIIRYYKVLISKQTWDPKNLHGSVY